MSPTWAAGRVATLGTAFVIWEAPLSAAHLRVTKKEGADIGARHFLDLQLRGAPRPRYMRHHVSFSREKKKRKGGNNARKEIMARPERRDEFTSEYIVFL